MSSVHRLFAALLCSTALLASGCVTPLSCGPQGACGPIAFGSSCDGCGDCDGCGELYIDPWINHPADACDPCDRCGNYNGQSCGKCRSVFDGFATLWGYRCEPPCDSCNAVGCDGGCGAEVLGCDGCDGCDSCGYSEPGYVDHGYGGDVIMQRPMREGEVIDEEVIEVVPTPTPAKEVQQPQPSESTYLPGGSRKVFRPKASVAKKPRYSRNY